MENLETLVQECVDFVLPSFQNLATVTSDILERPLEEHAFSTELLKFQWPALQNEKFLGIDPDAVVGLALRRIIIDSSPLEGYNDKFPIDDNINKMAVALDFSYHSRRYRKNPASWSTAFFSLFSSVLDSLSWPRGLLKFWPYAESRIEWFKMCNSLEPLVPGNSNLISYKQPLYDKLRHWNDILKTVQNNYYLNTQLDYEMKFKLEKFLSELLPLYEESNFNRSAMFSSRQTAGNPWNKAISSATRADGSSENTFAADYNYVFDELLTSPLEFIHKPLEFKIDMDKVLTPLLDAVFEVEEDFYRRIRKSHKTVSSINQKLNYSFPVDFAISQAKIPNYMKISQKNNEDRQNFWAEFVDFDMSLAPAVRPTLLDISISNPGVLYDQMLELDNDYYRKQFILQICFTANLIRRIITSPEVENYYKSCYQKEKPSRSVNFQSLSESNHKKTLSLCDHLIKNRTNKFYQHRDPRFALVVEKLLKSESSFLKAKIDGFKAFQSFKTSDEELTPGDIDYSYKKFGFVLLGNKSLNNVWKTKTGLDTIPDAPRSGKEAYDELNSSQSFKATDLEGGAGPEDRIVKEWQALRSLRSQYIFNFSQVDENSGLEGLFKSAVGEFRLEDRKRLLEELLEKVKEPHTQKLNAAREFMEDRMRKKRPMEDEKGQEPSKKFKSTNSEISSGLADDESPLATSKESDTDGTTSSQKPIEVASQKDQHPADDPTAENVIAGENAIGSQLPEQGANAHSDTKAQASTEATSGGTNEPLPTSGSADGSTTST